jgi:hypothetical protein
MSDLMNIGGGLYLPDMAALARDDRSAQADNQALAQNQYNMQRQQVTDGRADDQYSNTQMASQQAASGDITGARNAALGAGNYATLDHLDAVDDKTKAQAADDAEFVGRLVPALQQIPGDDGGAARREAARALLASRGATDAQINAHDFSDNGLALASAASMSIKDRLAAQKEEREANKPITAADGAVLTSDGQGGYRTIYTPGTKPLTQVVTDPVTGQVRVVNVPGTPGQGLAPGQGAAPAGAGPGAGGFAAIDNGFEKGAEGGYADRDGASGAPVNFGINQKYNPDINVRNLTPQAAQQIRQTRYWDASGAANQPTPAGQAVVYDTAINMGVPTAQRMLRETGGDPAKMLDWREQRYRSIAQNPANAGNLPNWLQRNNDLRQYVAQPGQQAPAQQGAQGAPAAGPTITDLGGTSGPIWKPATINGVSGQMNARTGEFHVIQGASDADPNDPAVDLAARQYVLTGKMPAMGNGGSSLRKAILEKAAGYSTNMSAGQIAGLRSQYTAHTATLTQLQKQRQQIAAAEDTALNSWQNYIDRSATAPGQTSSPLLNAPIQSFYRHVIGSPELTGMDEARGPAIAETARVLSSGPNGGGTVSDSSRNEQDEALSSASSVQQKQAARDALHKDMDGRLSQWDQAIAREQAGIDNLSSAFDSHGRQPASAAPTSAAPTSAAPRPTRTATNPQTGQKLALVNGQWVPAR